MRSEGGAVPRDMVLVSLPGFWLPQLPPASLISWPIPKRYVYSFNTSVSAYLVPGIGLRCAWLTRVNRPVFLFVSVDPAFLGQRQGAEEEEGKLSDFRSVL